MRVMIITQKNREEFEEIGFDDVTKRVAQNLYHGNKLEAARAWLKENDPAWMSARAAQAAGTKAIIALVLSGISLLVSIVPIVSPIVTPIVRAWFK